MYYVANKVVFTGVQILRDPGSNTEYNPDPGTDMCGPDRAMENKKMRMRYKLKCCRDAGMPRLLHVQYMNPFLRVEIPPGFRDFDRHNR